MRNHNIFSLYFFPKKKRKSHPLLTRILSPTQKKDNINKGAKRKFSVHFIPVRKLQWCGCLLPLLFLHRQLHL